MVAKALVMAIVLCALRASDAQAVDWITAPTAFTHNPYTGERVTQFMPPKPAFAPAPLDYETSGYHHTRSSLMVGPGADHLHTVQRWGRPVRPYGEWQRPFRPYSVPYPLWGQPPPLVGVGVYNSGATQAGYGAAAVAPY